MLHRSAARAWRALLTLAFDRTIRVLTHGQNDRRRVAGVEHLLFASSSTVSSVY